jgi:hypothetical protein
VCAATAAAQPALVDRIRVHMRESVSHLPDYTCRVTLERSTRRNPRAQFALGDRLRFEVAYTGGQELYAWPGDDRFEAGIEDLLPGHGMVSNGSYALHMRNLFVRDVAAFSNPREERCGANPCVRMDFEIPAARSGYSVSAGDGAAPVPLAGSAWFDPESLDILRLEVRVDRTPRAVRIAATRETTIYTRVRIGEMESVLPASSELVLHDRNGLEARNHATFDHCRRYAGSATIFYDTGAPAAADAPKPAPPPPLLTRDLTATLDAALDVDAAIGDPVAVTTSEGLHYTARIVNMRHAGNRWLVDLTLPGMTRNSLPLPAQGAITFRKN